MPVKAALLTSNSSPSTRRAWIEIGKSGIGDRTIAVALHPEGVDRNYSEAAKRYEAEVALHPEGVDRNPDQ